MAITQEDIIKWLSPEEPDYAAAARALGQPATAALLALVAAGDADVVARVVALAGAIGGDSARAVLDAARQHPAATVRTQVAAAARRLPDDALVAVVLPLLGDGDVSVRKFAIAAAGTARGANVRVLREALERMRAVDPEPALRSRAARALGSPSPRP